MKRIVIIGAGPGGYVAALRAARLGASVTVVEDVEVGGTCLNRGCIPTKALLASAELYGRIRRSGDFGIETGPGVTAHMDRIVARKDKVVATQVKGIRSLFRAWGVRLLEGRGRLLAPRRVEVSLRGGATERLEADAVIVATGSRPAEIPTFPRDGERIFSSDEAVHLAEVPRRLLIVGAGVIGCEFASLFGELGAEVTLLEMLPRAVATEDEEISAVLAREFKKRKIRLLTGVRTEKVDLVDGGVRATLADGRVLEADRMLVSIGRSINSGGLGLEDLGVGIGDRGEIRVDETMQTAVEGIYAVGDVTGGVMLAHVASKEGLVAVENIMGGSARMRYDVVPAAIFTHPEIGSVGLREHECREAGRGIRVGRFPFRALGKAHAAGEIAGLVKVIADARTDRILGAHLIGPGASDLVHELATAMEAGLTAGQVAAAIHAHPTLSEAVLEACEDVHGMAVHLPPEKGRTGRPTDKGHK